MATQADVRRIALALPDVEEASDKFAFGVLVKGKGKGFAWVWNERVVPKKPKVPNAGVVALRVSSLAQKDLMIAAEPAKFFTEPHYNGYPAVLVRLEAVSAAELEPLVAEARRCMIPSAPVRQRHRGTSVATGDATGVAGESKRASPRASSRTEAAMKKRGARDIPDFSKSRPAKGVPSAQDPEARKTGPAPTTRQTTSKPPATSSKSGRRGG